MSVISIILGFLQIILQALAAYFSYLIFRFNRLNYAWLSVTMALILMTFRRITALIIELGLIPQMTGTISMVDRIILPTIISILLLIGLWSMFKNFENFDVVEKKVKKSIKKIKERNNKW